MSSKSLTNDLRAYTTTRLASARIGLLWFGLTGSALLVSSWHVMDYATSTAILAALLIVQFRLWDDLADLQHDAHHHPQRVLVRTVHRYKFVLLCVVATLPSVWILWLWRDLAQLLVYAGLCAVMGTLYTASSQWPRIARGHLVLLKYPVFTWLCAVNPQPYRTVVVGTALWLVLALTDLHGDPSLRSSSHWRWIKNIELAALLVLAVLALQQVPDALRVLQP